MSCYGPGMRRAFFLLFALVGCATEPALLADEILAAPSSTGSGFFDADKAVNGVRGGGEEMGSTDVFSLGMNPGVDDFVILGWSGARAQDVPGDDLVVFENTFVVTGTTTRFMDHAIVEVSPDGVDYVAFPHDYLAEDERAPSADPSDWRGFAGNAPVFFDTDRDPDPFAVTAGGDRFDFAHLEGPVAERVREEGALTVRLIAAKTTENPDTGEPYPTAGAPDVDGVAARALR